MKKFQTNLYRDLFLFPTVVLVPNQAHFAKGDVSLFSLTEIRCKLLVFNTQMTERRKAVKLGNISGTVFILSLSCTCCVRHLSISCVMAVVSDFSLVAVVQPDS